MTSYSEISANFISFSLTASVRPEQLLISPAEQYAFCEIAREKVFGKKHFEDLVKSCVMEEVIHPTFFSFSSYHCKSPDKQEIGSRLLLALSLSTEGPTQPPSLQLRDFQLHTNRPLVQICYDNSEKFDDTGTESDEWEIDLPVSETVNSPASFHVDELETGQYSGWKFHHAVEACSHFDKRIFCPDCAEKAKVHFCDGNPRDVFERGQDDDFAIFKQVDLSATLGSARSLLEAFDGY